MSEYRIKVIDSSGNPLPVTVYAIDGAGTAIEIFGAGPVKDGFTLTDDMIPTGALTLAVQSDGYYPLVTNRFYDTTEVEVNEVTLNKKSNYLVAVLVGAALLLLAQRYFK